MDGEDLDPSELLEITVEFLKHKSTVVLEEIKDIIPKNLSDLRGRTLIHWAVANNQLEKTRFLIENELADKQIKDLQGYNILEIACKNKNKQLIEYLKGLGLECSLKPEQMINSEPQFLIENRIVNCIYADNACELELLKDYIQNKNGWVFFSDFYEWNLLGICGHFLSPKCMDFLIKIGCDPNAEDGDGLDTLDNTLNSLMSVMPPENEEEYIDLDSGIDCVILLIGKMNCLDGRMFRINTLYNKAALVGKGSSTPQSDYEARIERKTLGFRLALSTAVKL